MSERRSVTREDLAAAIHEYGGACRFHYGRRTCSAEDHWIMAVAIFDALSAEAVAPHPGEHHEFRIVCRRCEPGMVRLSIITPDEGRP